MLNSLRVLFHQGRQFIPDLTRASMPGIFRGRPLISGQKVNEAALADLCPTGAIGTDPVSIDMGKCTFCGECAFAYPDKIKFTKDYKLATNERDQLIVTGVSNESIRINAGLVRKEIKRVFHGSLKLREVSAAGDNSCELELNACGNVNFDMGRFGIEFVASPRHADGLVITGPVSENMNEPLRICYEAIPEPKIIILAGTDAISGGIFKESPAINRSFIDAHAIDLFVPGNPVHPLTFINGILDLIKKRY
jgi:Ni,Fe-hydrogenase III small subunit